jgi:hypothetical protein
VEGSRRPARGRAHCEPLAFDRVASRFVAVRKLRSAAIMPSPQMGPPLHCSPLAEALVHPRHLPRSQKPRRRGEIDVAQSHKAS